MCEFDSKNSFAGVCYERGRCLGERTLRLHSSDDVQLCLAVISSGLIIFSSYREKFVNSGSRSETCKCKNKCDDWIREVCRFSSNLLLAMECDWTITNQRLRHSLLAIGTPNTFSHLPWFGWRFMTMVVSASLPPISWVCSPNFHRSPICMPIECKANNLFPDKPIQMKPIMLH